MEICERSPGIAATRHSTVPARRKNKRGWCARPPLHQRQSSRHADAQLRAHVGTRARINQMHLRPSDINETPGAGRYGKLAQAEPLA